MTSDPVALAHDLVEVLSVNPELDGGNGEAPLIERVGNVLDGLGLATELQPVDTARSNILGVLPGTVNRTYVLEAHLDTVPMATEPCPIRIDNGRLWGRGSCDTKASMAAMLCALGRLVDEGGDHPTVIFAGVVDEEFVMRGAQALASRIQGVDGVIIGEPTSLRPIRAHNGCLRFEVMVHGVTAHTSKAHLGRNAVLDAARVTLALERRLGERLLDSPHRLTGAGLLTATEMHGGVAPNVVPDQCSVRFDRRLVPGETPAAALAQVDEVLEELRRKEGVQTTRSEPWLHLPPVEMPEDHPLVRLTEQGTSAARGSAHGVPYCTDANVLTGEAGIPSVVIGPGSIDQAHAPVEWVDTSEIHQAVDLYANILRSAGAPGGLER